MFIRQHIFIFLIILTLVNSQAFGSDSNSTEISDPKLSDSMDYGDALIYGLVEGVTEFLPISSTGHLIIVSEFLSSSNNGSEEALNAYLIVIQAGAILAVALIYRRQVFSMFLGVLGLDPRGKRLALLVIVAFLPAALLGPLLDHKIEEFLFGLLPIAIALFLGALLMFWAEKRKQKADSVINVDDGKMLDELLGLLTLSAAAGYKLFTKWDVMHTQLSIGPIIFGCLIAGVSAALSVFWLVGYLSKKGLGVFVWYRIILSMILLAIYFRVWV
jgi:undecaprenyl-diphosphatase